MISKDDAALIEQVFDRAFDSLTNERRALLQWQAADDSAEPVRRLDQNRQEMIALKKKLLGLGETVAVKMP